LKGSSWNQKWCLKEPFLRFFETPLYVLRRTLLGNGCLKNSVLKGSLWNQKWCLEEPFFKVLLDIFIGYLWNQKWCLKGPFFKVL